MSQREAAGNAGDGVDIMFSTRVVRCRGGAPTARSASDCIELLPRPLTLGGADWQRRGSETLSNAPSIGRSNSHNIAASKDRSWLSKSGMGML